MHKRLLPLVWILIGLFLMAACADDPTPTRPIYPTDTLIATPVPLILTPIATERTLPGLPPHARRAIEQGNGATRQPRGGGEFGQR